MDPSSCNPQTCLTHAEGNCPKDPASCGKTYHERDGLRWCQWRREDGVLQIELTGDGFLTDLQAEHRAGDWLREEDAVLILREDADVYKPRSNNVLSLFMEETPEELENRLLVSFRKGVFDPEMCRTARELLRDAATITDARGTAAGKLDPATFKHRGEGYIEKSPWYAVSLIRNKAGELVESGTRIANSVASGVVGSFDSSGRIPYCRQTRWTRDNLQEWAALTPFIQEVDRMFRTLVPHRWGNQKRFVERIKDGWLVPGTVFTTCTVNRNFRTACHTDRGDLAEGFGNLVAFEGERGYHGGYTIFPKFRVGVDARMGDFLGMDVHEWHGNTPLSPKEAPDPALPEDQQYERISLVCYCRVAMAKCDAFAVEDQKRRDFTADYKSHWKRYQDEAAGPRQDALEEDVEMLSFLPPEPEG